MTTSQNSCQRRSRCSTPWEGGGFRSCVIFCPNTCQLFGGNVQTNSKRFTFDGGAATYVGTALLGILITVVTLGICYPFAVVLRQRWRAKHSYIDGKQLIFTGSAWGLFGNWIKWLLLSIITLGIYLFWVGPRIQKWIWENTDFAVTSA
jgi:uncharacterized membrane protein YjgN (DUF898 family)